MSLGFADLAGLQKQIAYFLDRQVVSLSCYHLASGGFMHLYGRPKSEFSKSSTATCVLSLKATGCWEDPRAPWRTTTEQLAGLLLDPGKWDSAGLGPKNPFSVAFMLEAAVALSELLPSCIARPDERAHISEAVTILNQAVENGAARLGEYPPSAFLTQLVVRVLLRLKQMNPDYLIRVRNWAATQVEHEYTLIRSESRSADPLSLAYAVMLVALASEAWSLTPDENLLLRTALDCLFECQRQDGTWPLSRPLFHYPSVGNAHCFEYEMLTQLLGIPLLREHCLRHLDSLRKATEHLAQTLFQLENGGFGWASGHHPQLQGPESWSTASVYNFLYELDRLLSEALRRSTFGYVGSHYYPARACPSVAPVFAPDVLDSDLEAPTGRQSLKAAIRDSLLDGIWTNSPSLAAGRKLPRTCANSILLFGPPGTAKTRLATEMASFLGWPLLTVDPSHVVRKGLDQVQAETNAVFGMLAACERIVVLLDEFDELLRERSSALSESSSRFLTTAMLPRLAEISAARRILLVIATNHIEEFDFAIRRPGRVDLVLQVMPPSAEAKLARFPLVTTTFANLGVHVTTDATAMERLSDLTYDEFDGFQKRLATATDAKSALDLLESAHIRCTLSQKVPGDSSKSWKALCKDQTSFVRMLAM